MQSVPWPAVTTLKKSSAESPTTAPLTSMTLRITRATLLRRPKLSSCDRTPSKGPRKVIEHKQRKSDLTTEGRPNLSRRDLNAGSADAAVMPKLLTTDDVAEMTGLSPETLAQWRWLKKEIPFVRLGKKCVRYRQSDIDAWLAKRLVSVTSGENP